MAEPTGQFSIAFDDDALKWDVTWTHLAQNYPNLVTSYTIDRGRQFELDHTDVGRAVVQIADVDGILDPTNESGPYFGKIQPMKQAAIARWNPVEDAWYTRYRGWIEEFDYDFDPSQRVNKLTVSLVSIQAILSAIEMYPGVFGIDTTGSPAEGQVGFPNQTMKQRIEAVLGIAGTFDGFTYIGGAGIPDEFSVVFTGNVDVYANTYSPGETAMEAIQDAADAEFPGVSNVYDDRLGRLCIHGRLAKFDPGGTAATADPGAWDFTHWQVGDGAAVNAAPHTLAHVRSFSFNRGKSKIINSAFATPLGMADADAAGQLYQDSASIGQFGYATWSAQNLLTKRGILDDTSDLVETKRFAQYYVMNYAYPRNRITTISFRSMRPTDDRAGPNWRLLSTVDIGDLVDVTVASPGGGGFDAESYFVEGVHEQVSPLNSNYDDATLTLDLSPQAYFTSNPFPLPE